MHQLTIGFSPCPNDTFIFHGLVKGLVDTGALAFAPEKLADVETLNEWALTGRLDVTKLSFHALGHVLDEYVLLRAGAALGRGCGPLVVARERLARGQLGRARVAIPGRLTTAAMLFRLWAPECSPPTAMPFHQIMAAIKEGRVDAGVIIHESRFTYQQQGLVCLADLGSWWEETSGHPIPLGGIVARRSLGPEIIARVETAIRASIRRAWQRPEEPRQYIKTHAQELDDRVISEHIGLYVNRFSEDLGAEGLAAIEDFLRRGAEAGITPAHHQEILQPKQG